MKTFQEYLEEYWMSDVSEGETKDQCEEAEENWESQLDVQEVIDLAESWGKEMYTEGQKVGIVQGGDIALKVRQDLMNK